MTHRPRWPWGATCAITAIAAAAAWLALARAADKPPWWNASSTSSAAVARAAQELEGAATAQLTALRNDQPWSVSLSQDDANDWLAARLPVWARSRDLALPDQLRALSVAFTPEGILAGASVRTPAGERCAWVLLQPRIDTEGLWLTASRAGIGRAELPLAQVLALLPDDPATRDAVAVLEGRKPATTSPSLRVDGARTVRLLDIRPQNRRLELTASTGPQ